jgi:hypothetical protein
MLRSNSTGLSLSLWISGMPMSSRSLLLLIRSLLPLHQASFDTCADLSDPILQYYRGGVYAGGSSVCTTRQPTHALLLVGLRDDGATNSHWILIAPFGPSWGDRGRILVKKVCVCACVRVCVCVCVYIYILYRDSTRVVLPRLPCMPLSTGEEEEAMQMKNTSS